MEQKEWPKELVSVIAKSIKHHRTSRHPKLSTQKLADRCKELGMPSLTRSVITSIEMGARESISVPEWLVLAKALDVPPLLLLFPVGRLEKLEILPGDEQTPWDALKWAEHGDLAPSGLWEAIPLFRQHAELVTEWDNTYGQLTPASTISEDERVGMRNDYLENVLDRVERDLKSTRLRIRERGLIPPRLPRWLMQLDEVDAE